MIVVVKPDTPRKNLKALLWKAKPPVTKELDARKHLGVLNLKENPSVIQRRLRDEWG